MGKISLANMENCTGCMNCMVSCNNGAISMTKDTLDNLHPIIDGSKCVECGSCVRACPALSPVKLHTPKKCYAAYSTDKNIRLFSASGGGISSIYKLCMIKGYSFTGVQFDIHTLTANHRIGFKEEDIERFRNSKYTFSFMNSICVDILEQTKSQTVCFVGLPCQVAAVKKFADIHHIDKDRLFFADLVCHGVPSHEYLKEHIKKAPYLHSVAVNLPRFVRKILYIAVLSTF